MGHWASREKLRVEPRFPRDNKCKDKNKKLCKKWKDLGGCSRNQNFHDGSVGSAEMFDFMVLTCQESCGVCGEAGCVDEHPQCPEWARSGSCFKNPEFMGHTCRESCGTCGFLAPDSKNNQVVRGKQYSDFSKDDFHCGKYKKLCEVNGVDCGEEEKEEEEKEEEKEEEEEDEEEEYEEEGEEEEAHSN